MGYLFFVMPTSYLEGYMARGDTRGVPVAVSIVLALAAACLAVGTLCLTAGSSTESLVTNFAIWYAAAGVLFAIAILVYVATYWVLPYFRGSRASGRSPSITVDNSPNTTVEANAPRENFGEIEVKDSPGTDIRCKESG